MKIVLNPTQKTKDINFITYEEVKPGQCFVAKMDLHDKNPSVWIKTNKIIDGHQYCALLNTPNEKWEDGRLGYYQDFTEVVLVNMLCITTYDQEEKKEDRADLVF